MPGEHKLFVITYSWIAKQAGVSTGHARNSASAGEFEPRDIDSVLHWVNKRRAAKGLPLIGIPGGGHPATQDSPPNSPENTEPNKSSREN